MIVAMGRENEGMLKTLVDLGFGQLVSFVLAMMTFSASLVSTQGTLVLLQLVIDRIVLNFKQDAYY